MPFILIGIGGTLVYLLYLGTANIKAAGSLLANEFWSGNDPYWKWLGAIIIVVAIGSIPEFEGLGNMLLILVVLTILLAQSSGFTKLVKDL